MGRQHLAQLGREPGRGGPAPERGQVAMLPMRHEGQLADGTASYIVHFREAVQDITDFLEKKTMSFQATGRHGLMAYGHECASALAFQKQTFLGVFE